MSSSISTLLVGDYAPVDRKLSTSHKTPRTSHLRAVRVYLIHSSATEAKGDESRAGGVGSQLMSLPRHSSDDGHRLL